MGKVITYRNEGAKGIFSQIKLDNGDRVLISIAADEVKIFKMKFFGMIPGETIWEYPDLFRFAELLTNNGYEGHPLDFLVEKVQNFSSTEQLINELNSCIVDLEKK